MALVKQRLAQAPLFSIVFYRLLAFVITAAISASVVAVAGQSPLELADVIVHSTFYSRLGWEDWLLYAAPLLLTSAAFAITARLGIWNIGMEGQFMAGSLAASIVGLWLHQSGFVALSLMVLAGIAGGMLWIAIPAMARVFFNVNEIITTLMLNFVASLCIAYAVTGPLRDTVTGALASSERIPASIPLVWGDVHAGVVVSFIVVVLLAIFMGYTRTGYTLRITGANARFGFYAGFSVKSLVLYAMLVSGALSGLAGIFEVAGTVHRLQVGISNNFGYLGIIVAILARGSFLGLIPSALIIAFLLNAGIVLQTMQLSSALVMAITGLLLLCIAIADEQAHYRITSPGKGK